MNKTEFAKNERERIARIMKSPEALAESAVEITLAAFIKADPRYKQFEPMREKLDSNPDLPGFGSKLLRHQENIFYGMDAARRGLQIKAKGEKR